jgi:phage-related protein
MKLISNWKAVLLNAWSVRLMIIAGLFDILERLLPYLGTTLQGVVPEGAMGVISIVILIGAAGARVLTQQGITNVPASETPANVK